MREKAALKSDLIAAPQGVVAGAAPHFTVAQCRRAWAAVFRAGGIDNPELDARVLIGHALGLIMPPSPLALMNS